MIALAQQLAQAYREACLLELQALKPGNVHAFADGHGMTVLDFIRSAEASSQVIAKPNLTLGQRIYQTIKTTRQAVSCNTNLGIVLLCAPIIQAALMQNDDALQANIHAVIQASNLQDAEDCFAAILLANPGGLGESDRHDVRQPATVTIEMAMQGAQDRDMVARQYATGFADVFQSAYFYRKMQETHNPAWSTTALYLDILSQWPDSHIVRKQGRPVALEVQAEAAEQLAIFLSLENPKLAQKSLLEWDKALKQHGINPGTSADLTVAAILVSSLLSHKSS
ncbi:MAG TPA: triphosphoribosyl-dephospho-CoA synthase [Methylophilus sp.]|nr:triphosphoribosyl-dephospho-CoA synthase [Methylophilus sp.]HQQ33645.1 triphosphoribosyl-dephospho-CoA synthase [Methylophilus sp.]